MATRARILADYVSGGATAAEFDYLDGVTSNIQTQLDAKSPTTGHASIATVGTVTSGTWQGTTVAVNQGGTGAATHTANNVMIGAGTSALTSIAPGADGQVLTSTGSVWQSEAAAAGGIAATHDGVVKGWAVFNVSSDTDYSTYNVSAMAVQGTGRHLISWDIDFDSDTSYAVSVTACDEANPLLATIYNAASGITSYDTEVLFQYQNFVAVSPPWASVIVIGDR